MNKINESHDIENIHDGERCTNNLKKEKKKRSKSSEKKSKKKKSKSKSKSAEKRSHLKIEKK